MKPLNICSCDFGRYFGSKSNDGTYQNIINRIPPHDVYVEAFAGKASIFKHKKLSGITFLNDIESI